MKNQKISLSSPTLLLLVLCIAIGVGFAYFLGISSGRRVTSQENSALTAQDTNKRKVPLYWHDPMVPGQRFDKPGKSPFMDMELVPVFAEENAASAEEPGAIHISPNVQQNLGVRIVDVIEADLPTIANVIGTVALNERDVVLVQARSAGYIEKLLVGAPMETVRKGQALAQLYIPEWVAAQEEYLTAKRMQTAGMLPFPLLDAAKQRMRLLGMSDVQVQQLEASGQLRTHFTITAPISGVITELIAREGMTLAAGNSLFRINGNESVWINAEIPENIAANFAISSAIEARTLALPGQVFKGKISTLLPQVNNTTRTVQARIEMRNRENQLIPGMFMQIDLTGAAHGKVLLVPSEAVIATGSRHVVMLALGNGKFVARDVEIGAETQGQTEIRKGLTVGQKIVVSGQFLIDSEANLKSSFTRMGELK